MNASTTAICSQRWRETDEEKRALDRSNFDMINEVRQAAEVHRQVSGLVHTSARGLFA
jgi:methionyl aminopeptidase